MLELKTITEFRKLNFLVLPDDIEVKTHATDEGREYYRDIVSTFGPFEGLEVYFIKGEKYYKKYSGDDYICEVYPHGVKIEESDIHRVFIKEVMVEKPVMKEVIKKVLDEDLLLKVILAAKSGIKADDLNL